MKRIPSAVWALILFGVLYLFFRFGIAPLTAALTGISAPLPSSLVMLYTGMTALGIILYASVTEDRWEGFIRPVIEFLREPAPPYPSRAQRVARKAVLVLIPLLVGWWAYAGATNQLEPPSDPPAIHFSLPNKYVGVENPFGKFAQWKEQDIREGGILYTKNCAMCHGDTQDGKGLFARAWQPKPANFRDEGTIAQLPENYLYWRIKEGGPGVPRHSIGYRSTMPVWDGVLTDEQIWKIIMFEYVNAGKKPAKRD